MTTDELVAKIRGEIEEQQSEMENCRRIIGKEYSEYGETTYVQSQRSEWQRRRDRVKQLSQLIGEIEYRVPQP